MTRRRPASLALALLAVTAPPAAAQATGPAPRLAGTVIGSGDSRALIELGTRQYGLAPGDAVDGWVVQSISAGRVMLLGPAGPVVLHLSAAPPARTDDALPGPWSNPCGRPHEPAARHGRAACRAAVTAPSRS